MSNFRHMATIGNESYKDMILDMLKHEHSHEDIHLALKGQGLEDGHISVLVAETRKLHDMKQLAVGLSFICGGAVICLASCIITLVQGAAAMSNVTLVGLTSVGVAVVFAGLMKIF